MSITRKKVSDLLGKTFNRLTVVEHLGKGKHKKHYWRCFCACGGWVDLTSQMIIKESIVSCGCFRKEKLLKVRFDGYKHGLHKHPLYHIYHSMLFRCSNPKAQRWEYYGGKGVKVCKEWQEDFISFYGWAYNNGYEEGLSIDRVDSSGNYCPENCRWITIAENTRRSNVRK